MGEKYIVRAGKKKITLSGYLEGLGAFEQMYQAKLAAKEAGAAPAKTPQRAKEAEPPRPAGKPWRPAE
jgi:hypothetical protein